MNSPQHQQMQELQQGLQGLQQQLQLLQQQKNELENLIDSLTELGSKKEGDAVLIPFGAGVFIKAKVETTETVILNVGANVVVEKSIVDTLALVAKQSKELHTIEQSMQEELAHMSQQLQFLQLSQASE
ncbi:MAG: prefoldin subunit alpha [bacterium]|nr:prefoldin subunit alpha [bacterium]